VVLPGTRPLVFRDNSLLCNGNEGLSSRRRLPMPVLVIGVAVVAVGFNLHPACCRGIMIMDGYSDVEAGVDYELRH
jgi:hypothetical protein